MMRTLGARLLAVLLGLSVFWAGGEVVCRALFRQQVRFDVEMWRYAREVKTVGLTPGLRFEHRPGVRARLMGVEVQINADGLREREIPRIKEPGVVRVAVVGDSVTFGWGVPQERTYPRQLEDALNRRAPLGPQLRFEVINFGVGNYAIDDAAAMLEHKALAYDPDVIVYGAFINDAETAQAAGEFSLLKHSMFAVWVWGRVDALWREWGWREDYQAYYNGLYAKENLGPRIVSEGLKRMAASARMKGVPLVVVLLPELHADAGSAFMPVRRIFARAASGENLPFLDLHEAITGEDPEKYWVSRDDAHPDEYASRLYAEAIAGGVCWEEILKEKGSKQLP